MGIELRKDSIDLAPPPEASPAVGLPDGNWVEFIDPGD